MSYLLSLDPGLRKCGVALWRGGELVAARLLVSERAPSQVEDVAADVAAMAEAVCYFGAPHPGGGQRGLLDLARDGLRLACEYPRTYGGRASRGDANDLVSVALVAGAIQGRLGCASTFVLPEEWKGGIPKPDSKAAYLRDGYPVEERAKLKLTTTELIQVDLTRDWRKNMDVWDAVGIGLWALKR